jgi:methylthioribose-1-phosphate isomerase
MSDEIRDNDHPEAAEPEEEYEAASGPTADEGGDVEEAEEIGDATEAVGVERLPRTIWWEDDQVHLVDQSRLPLVGDVLACDTADGVCWAIKGMAVRGAPALGVAAALGIALWARNESTEIEDQGEFYAALKDVGDQISATRPTAVNLHWGVQRMFKLASRLEGAPLDEVRDLLVQEALNMVAEDEARNRQLGINGAELFEEGTKLLTHCNAGSLATAYFGTALGVIFAAHEQGKIDHVWVDETRPVLQGARLTTWELLMAGIQCALITDSMAAAVMKTGAVDAVIVGADRIAANGDVANKIGTYGLAVLAKEHGIPFYVAAPTSTVDLTISSGEEIQIEHRQDEEVTGVTWSGVLAEPDAKTTKAFDMLTQEGPYEFDMPRGHQMMIQRKGGGFQIDGWARIAPEGVPVFNPAFDVTPNEYVSGIITERGVALPDAGYETSLAVLMMGAGAYHEVTVES